MWFTPSGCMATMLHVCVKHQKLILSFHRPSHHPMWPMQLKACGQTLVSEHKHLNYQGISNWDNKIKFVVQFKLSRYFGSH